MQAPSVALPVTTLAELCAGLPFDFGEALQPARAASALAATRVVFHRTTESVRNQAVVVLVLFKRLLAALRPESPVPRMAVLLPDVLPETSEIQCAVLLEVFLRRPDILDSANITVLSRRGPRLLDRLPPAFAGIRVDWDWSSPSILSSFDFVVVMCSAMHFALAQELTAGQDPFPRTLFFVATTGISPKRAQNILQSQNVVLPCFQFEPKPEDKRFDHWV
nr:hypothetical protein HK105_004397 [Polyrhizophydium stewartii]